MKLAVVGSRGFNDYSLLEEELNKYAPLEVISGGAYGADALARKWAKERNIPLIEFLPEWDKYGRSAGYIRNRLIIEACDECIAFWDGKSRGTKMDIALCKELNKPCKIIRYDLGKQYTIPFLWEGSDTKT